MSDVLSKNISTEVISPGTPPVPGVAPTPPYCITKPVKVQDAQYIPITEVVGGFVTLLWVWQDAVWQNITTCHPGSAGTPGIPGTPADVRTVYNAGWTGGARSIDTLSGNGRLDFSVGYGSSGIVAGFGYKDENADYYEITHGILVQGSVACAIESGVQHGSWSVAAGDVHSIQRIGTKVTYALNGTIKYTSTVPSTGTVFADCSMYLGGDSILSPSLTTVDVTLANTTGSVTGVLGQLYGFGGDSDGAELREPILSGLSGVAISYNAGRVAAALSGAVGEINAYTYPGEKYSSTSGKLAYGIVTSASGESGGLQPQYCITAGVLQPVLGFSIAIGGQAADVQAALQGLRGYAANVETAQCLGVLSPLTGKIRQGIPSDGFDWLYQTAPKPTLFAVGTADYGVRLGARLKFPKPTFLAYGAGQARLKAPVARISASGTVTSVGTAELIMPKPVLTISATVTRSGSLTKTVRPQWSLSAYAGGTARVRGSRPAILAAAKVGAIGRARLTSAWPTLNATGKVGDVVRVAGVLGGMVMPGMGVFVRSVPKSYLRSIAVTASTVTYEGYSITLLTDEQGNPDPAVTHYTNFPFDRIVRWGGKYYGVATDGLYELGGDTFNGSPIVAEVETAESDLGSPQFKHPRHLYMGGRMGADLTVKIKSAETDTSTYEYTPAATGARTRRVQFGRGIRARYFSFAFKNKDGDDFYVDELTPEMDVVRRRV